jgi:hypothetical protein
MQDELIFLIGAPRSGSTLLLRMLGSNPAVYAPPEPHLMTPLAHLGYYDTVEKAPYDPIITQRGLREIVGELPNGEADYLDALRAFTDTIYRRLLDATEHRLLLDKTPAYVLVLDFLAKLYPEARYIVLTRNPLAVWSSYVESFFDGDHEAAHRHNPLMERYVPAIARFLREKPVTLHHVRYEELVQNPEKEVRELCDYLGIEYTDAMVNYGERAENRKETTRGLGDPITVAKETRPTTKSLARWAEDMSGEPGKVELAARILAALQDDDLATWGFTRRDLQDQLDAVPAEGARKKGRGLSRYTLERKLLILLRRNIHHNAFGRLVRKLRDACNVLLR